MFESFYRTHYVRVRQFVSRRVAFHDVDDVLVETFSIALRRCADVPREAPQQVGWLLVTARHVIGNHHRSRRRAKALVDRLTALAPTERAGDDPSSPASFIGDEDLERIFYELSEDDQLILSLVAWDECTPDELAAVLGCTPGAAKTRSPGRVPGSVTACRECQVMGEQFDPVAWLKARDPLHEVPPAEDDETTRDAIFDRVVGRVTGRRRRSRRLIPVAAATAVLLGVTSAAAAVLLTRSSDPDPGTVVCFGESDLDASRVLVEHDGDPIAACRAAWTDAQFAEIFGGRATPALAACRLPSGVSAVFPADAGGCAGLGLAGLGSSSPPDAAIRRFKDAISDALDHGCMAMSEVEKAVRQALRSEGLDDWSVVVGPSSPDATCGSIDVDPITGSVRIVGVPPAPSPPGT